MSFLDDNKYKVMERMSRNCIGKHDRVMIDPCDVIDMIEEIRRLEEEIELSKHLHSFINFGDFND